MKCNNILSTEQAAIIQDTIKTSFNFWHQKLQKMSLLALDPTLLSKKLAAVAHFIYLSLQTLAAYAIFKEDPKDSPAKYQGILDRFKMIFMAIAQSQVIEKVFCEAYEFEHIWDCNKSKYTLSSFGNKRLTLFIQKNRLAKDENIKFSLKYVVVCYSKLKII